MPAASSKTWLGLIGDTLKWPPALLIIGGLFFLVLGIATSVGIRDYVVAAEAGPWRAISTGVGLLLILAGILLYWRESRPVPSEAKRPGPYTHGRFPITIKGPETNEPGNRITVSRDRQEVVVTGRGRELGPGYDYKLMLMHSREKRVSPRFTPIDRVGSKRGATEWETKVQLLELERITQDDEWRLAFYYVGPNARRLAEHHRALCEYFAPDQKPKRWPQIDNPPDEFVQCSEVLVLRFGPAKQAHEAKAEGGNASQIAAGTS